MSFLILCGEETQGKILKEHDLEVIVKIEVHTDATVYLIRVNYIGDIIELQLSYNLYNENYKFKDEEVYVGAGIRRVHPTKLYGSDWEEIHKMLEIMEMMVESSGGARRSPIYKTHVHQ